MKVEGVRGLAADPANITEREIDTLACAGEPAPAAPTVHREAADAHTAAIGAPQLDRRYVTAALMLVMVLASMEQTVTSTAMPTIIGDLQGLEHYSWVASIYLLACTVSMPLYG